MQATAEMATTRREVLRLRVWVGVGVASGGMGFSLLGVLGGSFWIDWG